MKQLETEYKNLIAMDIPDLWDRIEAGVDEYEAKKKEEKSIEEITAKADDNIVEIKKKTGINKRTIITIGKVLGAAACLFIAVNVFSVFRYGKNETGTANMAFDASPAWESAADSAPAEEDYAETDVCEEATVAADDSWEAEAEETAAAESVYGLGITADSFVYKRDAIATDKYLINAETKNEDETANRDKTESAIDPQLEIDITADIWGCDEIQAEKIVLTLHSNGIQNIDFGYDVAADEEVEEIFAKDELLCEYDPNELTIKLIYTATGEQYYVFTDAEDINIVAIAKMD